MGHSMSSSPDADELTELAHRHLWMHFSRLGSYGADAPVHVIARGEGSYAVGHHRAPAPRRPVGVVHRAGRPRPPRSRRRGAGPGRDARVLPDLDVRAPARDRARGAPRRPRSRRPQPRVLHQRRVRGGRVGVEAGAPVLPGHRAGPAPQGDLAAHRLPRHHARGARHHRHPRAAHAVRAAHARRGARRQHQPSTSPIRATTRRRSCSRSPTRSRSASCSKDPRPSPRCSSNRCRTRAGASCRPRATSPASARSATGTACCSCPTR